MKARKRIRLFFNYLVMCLIAIYFLFPIVFMTVSSFKTNEYQIVDEMSGLKAFIPQPLRWVDYIPKIDTPGAVDVDEVVLERTDFTPEDLEGLTKREKLYLVGGLGLQNFRDVISEYGFLLAARNSLIVALTTMIASIIINSMAAFALARLNFKGRRLVVAVVVALIIIPFEAIAIPLLLLTNSLPWVDGSIGWLDTLHVQIIPFIADPLAIFLFYQFFITLPKELEEAMVIDGANLFRVYRQLIIPLSRPVISTVAILKLLWMWGAYLWPKMVTRSPGTLPLTVAMQQFFGQYPRFWGNIMAFAAMMTIPLLLLFLIFQKAFVQSISSTGIKG